MSSAGETAPRPGRRRDAAASRRALLQAARELFAERGYSGTTLRDIGERAGVDAALVARYYGDKAGIYLAAVADEGADAVSARRDLARVRALADYLVARMDDRGGPGPMIRVALAGDTAPDVRAQVSTQLRQALVEPVVERMAALDTTTRRQPVGEPPDDGQSGVGTPDADASPARSPHDPEHARRRAQVVVAAVVGVAVLRTGGCFPELSRAPREELVELLEQSLGPLVGEQRVSSG